MARGEQPAAGPCGTDRAGRSLRPPGPGAVCPVDEEPTGGAVDTCPTVTAVRCNLSWPWASLSTCTPRPGRRRNA